ncbi:MAG: SCO family protein [Chloroflexi bacterium]|nr:SCO family protein [Chloroflexota bacterium]
MRFIKMFQFKIFAITLIIIMATASCGAADPALKGDATSPSTTAAEINLTDHNGQPFQLSSHHGKVALVFFGFSNCVDECPATLALIRQALETAGKSSDDVLVVMVSTDPVNDTPESMKEFMQRFDPAFLGLLGTPEELAKVWQDYGVVVEDGGETHSSLTYVVDGAGNLRETFSPEATSDDISADLITLLSEK